MNDRQGKDVDVASAPIAAAAPTAFPAVSLDQTVEDSSAHMASDASGDPPAEAPRIAGFKIVELIGVGGMGTVWHAVQLSTHREVALKVMSASAWASPRARLRFDREVEIASRLEHPNIARIYESGLQVGLHYYAMERLYGEHLDMYIERTQTSGDAMLRLFASICDAVQHAHQRGVIHRDLKPSNILVTKDGTPYLLDFGLAKDVQSTAEAGQIEISTEGIAAGTPVYMSPEQAAGHVDKLDTRTDVFSLGTILYRLWLRRFPHDLPPQYIDVVRTIRDGEITRPRTVDSKVPKDLEAILLKALARNPDDRYLSAGEFSRDIRAFLAGEPVSAQAATTWYIVRRRLWRHRVSLTVAAAFVGVLAISAIVSYIRISLERDVAIAAKRSADTARVVADRERKAADQARHDAELRLADSLISQGNVSTALQNWPAAKSQFRDAAATLQSAKVSTIAADFGLFAAERQSPTAIHDFTNLQFPISAAAICPDGRHLLVGGSNGDVRLMNLDQANDTQAEDSVAGEFGGPLLSGHSDAVTSVVVRPDGKQALSASRDGAIIFWGIPPRHPEGVLVNRSIWVTHLNLSPDGALFLSVSGETAQTLSRRRDDMLTLWDSQTGQFIGKTQASGRVVASTFSPKGDLLLTGGAELQLWQIGTDHTLKLARKLNADLQGSSVTALAFSPDQTRAAVGRANGGIAIIDIDSGDVVANVNLDGRVSALQYAPDGHSILAATENQILYRLDAQTAREMRRWMAEPAPGQGDSRLSHVGATFNFDKNVAVLFSSNRVVVFDINSEPGVIRIRPADVPGQLAVWNAASSQQSVSLPSPGASTSDVAALSPDGRMRVVASKDKIATISDVNSDKTLARLIGHTETINAVCFSPDGQSIATGAGLFDDFTVRFWDLHGNQIHELRGHTAAVRGVAYSPDGSFLVSVSEDGTARFWQPQSGDLLRIIPLGDVPLTSVHVSSDGGKVLITAVDGSAILLDLFHARQHVKEASK